MDGAAPVATNGAATSVSTNGGGVIGGPRKSKRDIVYRVLSRALRDQLGDAMFDRIQAVHDASIAFREASDEGAKAARKAQLDELLALPLQEQLHVIRAFSYFRRVCVPREGGHAQLVRRQQIR